MDRFEQALSCTNLEISMLFFEEKETVRASESGYSFREKLRTKDFFLPVPDSGPISTYHR